MRFTKKVIKEFQEDAKALKRKSELGQAFGFRKLVVRLIRGYALTKEEACDILEFKNEEEILERLEKRYIKRKIKKLKMKRLYVFEVDGKISHLIARRGDAMTSEDCHYQSQECYKELKIYPILTDFHTFIRFKIKENGDIWEDKDFIPITLEELEGKQEKFNHAFKNAPIYLTSYPDK